MNITKVTAQKLREMQIGETCVFSERITKNAGAPTQSYACRAGIKVVTAACLIVLPNEPKVVKAILVTRIA